MKVSAFSIVTRMGGGGDQGCMIEASYQVPTASSLVLLGDFLAARVRLLCRGGL